MNTMPTISPMTIFGSFLPGGRAFRSLFLVGDEEEVFLFLLNLHIGHFLLFHDRVPPYPFWACTALIMMAHSTRFLNSWQP